MRQTTLLREVLEKYPNEAFVETGTADGSGVQLALDLGFKSIWSIELDNDLQEANRKRFEYCPNVELITGDSITKFPKVMRQIKEPATIWLDAHAEKLRDRPYNVGVKECPLYEELTALSNHPVKTHTILIDDLRVFGKEKWGTGIVKDRVIQLVRSINRRYKISYEDNTMAKDDILAAHL